MHKNEETVRELYAAAEARGLNVERFLSFFSQEGYMLDVPSGTKLRGQALGDSIAGFARAFPDGHRELLRVYVADNVVVVELATRGTHEGDLPLPSGALPATGRSIDFPSCDVFHLENGKVKSFHCYNAVSVLMQQLTATSEETPRSKPLGKFG